MERIEALKKIAFEKDKFEGFLILNSANLIYFTGFPGANALLIPKDGENTIYVYNVNYEQAKAEAKGFRVELVKRDENWMAKIAKHAKELKIGNLDLDAVGIEGWRALSKKVRGETRLTATDRLGWKLREVKDEKEIRLMRKAGELTSEGM